MPGFPVALGAITLDGVRFSTDPGLYEPLNWPTRQSLHPADAGALVVQDFGLGDHDDQVHLGSAGRSGQHVLDTDTVYLLHNRFRRRGGQYRLLDWLGNDFTVFIGEFTPVPFGVAPFWTYDMLLLVLRVNALLAA